MAKTYHILIAAAACSLLASCFKDEPLNAECDIEEAYIHADNPEAMFFQDADSLVKVTTSERVVNFMVRKGTDLTGLAPCFRITEGATISPASGSAHDFSTGGVAYRVTSQDGAWHKDYTVRVTAVGDSPDTPEATTDTVKYDFEHYFLDPSTQKYYVWSDLDDTGTEKMNWASGNGGFFIARGKAQPDEYPTVPYEQGCDGMAVKLETRSTGAFGILRDMRIAAGNLFTGRFDEKMATKQPLDATHFGDGASCKTARRPLRITGYYQYTPGPTYTDKQGNAVNDKTDQGDIYAILFKNTDSDGNAVYLTGDNVQTSPLIVARALSGHVTRTEGGWKQFDLPFEYVADVDPDVLARYGYSIAVVFTSSSDGASFEGAVGSTLLIDKVRLVVEK